MIYVRQADEIRVRQALWDQIRKCRLKAIVDGYTIDRVVTESWSSEPEHHSSELLRLLEAAERREYTALIVIDFDALGPREVMADAMLLLLEKSGIQVIPAGDDVPTRATRKTALVETAMTLLTDVAAFHQDGD